MLTQRVAPHTGERIETQRQRRQEADAKSPLTQGRGSKLLRLAGFEDVGEVAPHTGARIETAAASCGVIEVTVAPHPGARIETSAPMPCCSITKVAPHTGARIET